MSFDLSKDISIIEKDLKEDEKQLQKINDVVQKIPKNVIDNYIREKNNTTQQNLDDFQNTLNIINKLEEINNTQPLSKKLILLKELFEKNKITNPEIKKLICNNSITEDDIKLIEKSILNINYPIFEGKILMTIYEELNTENKEDLLIFKTYFEICTFLVSDVYKEFPNYGSMSEIIKKITNVNLKINFVEMLPEFLYKKILATIFYNKTDDLKIDNENNEKKEKKNADNDLAPYKQKLSENEFKILTEYETLISYILKSIENTSELLTMLIDKNPSIKNLLLKNIISNLLEKMVLFFTSEKSPMNLSNVSTLLLILLIGKSNELNNEFINNYQYDPFKNIFFYDWIKYYISNDSSDLTTKQNEFSDFMIKKLRDNITNELNNKSYKTEDLLEDISMIIKDSISLYETLRSYKIIENLLMPSCNQILDIFKKYYQKDSEFFGYNKNSLSLDDSLFLINLLYSYMNITKNEFNLFLERLELYEKSIREKISENFETFNNSVFDLFQDFIQLSLCHVKFEKIISLYDAENLKKGNNLEDINKNFRESYELWSHVREIMNKIKASRNIYKVIENEVVNDLCECLSKKIFIGIEKIRIEGKNLDILIDKSKMFIDDNFFVDENEVKDETKNNIKKLYAYMDNLFMNKK